MAAGRRSPKPPDAGFSLTEVVVSSALLLVIIAAAVAVTNPVMQAARSEPELVDRLKLEQSTYEGPTGIVGVFQDACVKLDVPAVSYWAAVPHYVAQPPCPKATRTEPITKAARTTPRTREDLVTAPAE